MANHPNRRSAMPYITLTTGASIITRRSDVHPDVIAMVRTALAADGRLGPDWLIQLRLQTADGATWAALYRGLTLADCWLCASATVSDAWWETVEARAHPDVILVSPRGAPWLATDLIVPPVADILSLADGLRQLGDLTRCVAWALYDRINGALA